MYNDYIMRTVSVTEFKAHCLRLIEEVARTGQRIVLTKRGKKIAVLSPPEAETPHYEPGKFRGTAEIVGDLIAPFDVDWESGA